MSEPMTWKELASIALKRQATISPAPMPLEQWLAAKADNVVCLNPEAVEAAKKSQIHFIAFDELKPETDPNANV